MFMKDPVVGSEKIYMANASLSLKTIIGATAVATMFSVFAVNPLLEFITSFVSNSGY